MQEVSEEKELMISIINGDKKSFDTLYNKEYRKVLFYSVQYLHDKALAEDIAQDSFIALWEKRKLLDPEFPIQPYLYSIVKNRCLNLLRKLANDKRIRNEVMQKEYRASIISLTDDSSDVVIKFQLEEYIKKAYKELPEKVSATFIMNRMQGMTYQEISDVKGISVKTVEYHITQALKIFRIRLKEFL